MNNQEWNKKVSNAGMMFVYIIIGFFIICLIGVFVYAIIIDGTPATSSNSKSVDKYDAMVQAEHVVKDSLKSPSTAKFSSENATENSDGSWTVTGDVDAQNSFGATIRNSFTVKLKYDGSKWTVISKSISE